MFLTVGEGTRTSWPVLARSGTKTGVPRGNVKPSQKDGVSNPRFSMSNARDVRHILVVEDQKSKRIVALRENSYTLGRDPSCSIIIYDRQVSRHHATLLRVTDYQNQQDFYRVIDGDLHGKKSTNGITVNGKYSLSHELRPGDTIHFGSKARAIYQVVPANTDLEFLDSEDLADLSPELSITGFLEKESDFHDEENHTIAFALPKPAPASSPPPSPSPSFSIADYSPYPIVEFNQSGEILYQNAAASRRFPDLGQRQGQHPLLQGLAEQSLADNSTSFSRELEIEGKFFEQYITFTPERIVRTFCVDITKYKENEEKNAIKSDYFRFIREQSTEGIFLIDAEEKKILETNLAYCKLLGYTERELIGRALYGLIAVDRENLDSQLGDLEPEKPFYVEESLHRGRDGSLITVEEKITRSNLNGRDIFCFSVRDIGERKRFEERLYYQSLHDALTDLPNRLLFERQLTLALANARRNHTLLAVLFVNLDSFKNINHALGHSIGDRVLQEFGRRLSVLISGGDAIARWGSDEFTILLPRPRKTEDTIRLAERIFDSLKTPIEVEGNTLQPRASIGIALYPQDGEDEETLLKNASAALHRAKEAGRGQYQFYSPALAEEAGTFLKLETLLHQALDKQEFALVYQPQIAVASGRITGIEAFLRWNHPPSGVLSPAKFLALAEKTDILLPIGKWVLTKACEQAISWQKDGLPPVPVCVNLSNPEFARPNLVETIARVLEKTGLDPQWLEIEITEKILRQNLSSARQIFQDLQNLGVRVALDDFGTGYSALGYLQQFPFRTLKLDQNFVRDLRGSDGERAIVSAAVALGKGFHFRIVAEGVETRQQLDFLQDLGCEEAQGYYFSRPISAEAIGQLLSQQGKISISTE
ncbi:EAL domain-containing protein [Pannus brasiliensis CCIBt3594]|uniref:EAL domain-containing protein n=1 Tax=Pannus brasiliensis CCIBt3594 TaxID=1427578 RepID=A0AAW9QYB7_9CHRO